MSRRARGPEPRPPVWPIVGLGVGLGVGAVLGAVVGSALFGGASASIPIGTAAGGIGGYLLGRAAVQDGR